MQRSKSRFLVAAAILLLIVSSPLLAGPLDRSDVGPRVNPATNDMLRVPGVVGMDPQSALAALQQAGLNPQVHTVRQTMKIYAGQEGTVVKQLPGAGGVAMLGSSVGITVYEPGGSAPGAAGPDRGTPPTDQYGNDGGDTGAAPGQPVEDGGDDGAGSGADSGAPTPLPLPPGGGWHGPTQAPVISPPASPPIAQPTAPVSPTVPVISGPVPTAPPVKPEGHKALLSPHQGGL